MSGTNDGIFGSDVFVEAFGYSDVGLVRARNDDSFCIADLNDPGSRDDAETARYEVGARGALFAVCDGVGGAAAGDVASQLAVDTLFERLHDADASDTDEELAELLERSVDVAARRIRREARLDSRLAGMSTTVTAAVVARSRLLVAQVGDSRAYIVRGERVYQITKDQSWMQLLVDHHCITLEEAAVSETRHVLLQALGSSDRPEIDITHAILRKGDTLVVCSDGLSGFVPAESICRIVNQDGDIRTCCYRLVDMACDLGGDDNITVIVARFGGDGLDEPGEDEELSYEQFDAGLFGARSAATEDAWRERFSIALRAFWWQACRAFAKYQL